MDQLLQNGAIMSVMRRSGNSIDSFQFHLDGQIYSGKQLADYYDQQAKAEQRRTAQSVNPNHVRRRKVGLEHFNQKDYVGALSLFKTLAVETQQRSDWFNVFSAQIHLKNAEAAQRSLEIMRSISSPRTEDGLTPAEEQFHAARLFAQYEFGDLAARELLALADHYRDIVDDTFLHLRRIPMFGSALRVMQLLAKILPADAFTAFEKDFTAKLGPEARELLHAQSASP